MNINKIICLCLVLFTIALISPRDALSCTCTGMPSVLDAFERAEHVVIVKVTAVKKAEDPLRLYEYAVMTVEKTYKGGMKPGEDVVFRQTLTSCDYILSDENVGIEYLLYLGKPQEGTPPWHPFGGCGRSKSVKAATEDFLYLDNLALLSGKTRISGQVRRFDGGSIDLGGMKVAIRQGNKEWKVYADSNGFYDIYDLPAGEYDIEPELPDGWRINTYSTMRSSYTVPGKYTGIDPKTRIKEIAVVLKEEKHVSMDFLIIPDNAVRGRLLLPADRLMEEMFCLNLVRVDGKPNYNGNCADKNGGFYIDDIAEGEYMLYVRNFSVSTATSPSQTLYYPGVADKEKAEVISIKPGAVINIEFRIPEFEGNR